MMQETSPFLKFAMRFNHQFISVSFQISIAEIQEKYRNVALMIIISAIIPICSIRCKQVINTLSACIYEISMYYRCYVRGLKLAERFNQARS